MDQGLENGPRPGAWTKAWSMDQCAAWTSVRHGPVCGMDRCTAWWHGPVYGMVAWTGVRHPGYTPHGDTAWPASLHEHW